EGDRTKAASGKTYEVRNPATGEVVDEVPAGGPADVDKAAQAAAKAFTTWSKLPANQRREILHKASQHMLSKVEEIAPVLTKEQGKTLLESRLEARRFGENIGWFADLADKIHGQYVRLPDLTTYGLVVRRPIGVCGAIVPWNFPLTLAANKVAPAIAAGNTVVLKPASTTPLATLLSTKRLYVQEGAYDALMEKLVARAAKLKPGNGLDKDSRMGPMHTETQRAEVEAQLKDAVDRGAKVVFGGGRPEGSEYERGWFI